MVIVRGLYRKEVAGSNRSSYGYGTCVGSVYMDAAMRSASYSNAKAESAHETRQLKHTCTTGGHRCCSCALLMSGAAVHSQPVQGEAHRRRRSSCSGACAASASSW